MLNSIVRGFGLTIGRKAADNMIENLGQSNGEYKESPSLSGKQIWKVIGWSIIHIITSLFLSIIPVVLGWVNEKNQFQAGVVIWIIGVLTFINGYYQDNKKVISQVNARRVVLEEKERLIYETEELYISEKITKREYELLMKKINKM
jgi:magnesium-transporting ATPase (P-type)